jgi:hypothetical protein
MAVTITWNITGMRRTVEDGGVFEVDWECVASEDGLNGTVRQTHSFNPNPDGETFIVYEDLTEANVLSWVKGENQEFADDVESEAKNSLLIAKEEAKVASGVPWS